MVDLTTSYLGLSLKNPLVASSSPLSEKLEKVQALEKAGVAGVIMYSLFEEQIIRESIKLHEDLMRGSYSSPEALTYIPEIGRYSLGPDRYIEHLSRVKEAVSIPVIGSLNGVSTGGWIDYARKIEQAGADALELNLYNLVSDPQLSSAEVEESQITLVGDVCEKVKIPVAVKLSPFYTSLPNFASRLAQAGAKGLVLFNRFYQPDLDAEALEVVPNLVLSNSDELRLPLRWIAILYGRVQADLALTTGVHDSCDMVKAIMSGASVAMVASALLQRGIEHVDEMLCNFTEWLGEHEYVSVNQMRGSMSQQAVAEPDAFERANYMKVLSSY
jgi:dihydroorotate dehydrogenase (fumarate)